MSLLFCFAEFVYESNPLEPVRVRFICAENTRDKNYDRNAGEIEAFDVGRRASLTAEERKNTRPDIDREDVVFAHENNVGYNIVELDNGKQYVEATEKQVISGTDPTIWAQQVADYINNVIRGYRDFIIKTTEGDYLTITRDTAYKGGTRNQIQNPDGTYRLMTDAEYRVKLNAEVHINELAEVSKKWNRPNVPDAKNHKFAKNGFSYRTAYFKDFDGKYYKLTISVGENGSVSTVYNVGRIKKDTLPNGKIKTIYSGSKANSMSDISIPQKTDLSTDSEKKVSEKRKYDLTDSELDADGAVKDEYFEAAVKRAMEVQQEQANITREERAALNNEVVDCVEKMNKSEKIKLFLKNT